MSKMIRAHQVHAVRFRSRQLATLRAVTTKSKRSREVTYGAATAHLFAAVLVDQAAEHVDPVHHRCCGNVSNDAQRSGRNRWLQIEGPVWPGGVVVP
jgi:hypothetical protein